MAYRGSILDKVLGSLMPVGPEIEQFLGPEDVSAARRSALSRAGLAAIAASGQAPAGQPQDAISAAAGSLAGTNITDELMKSAAVRAQSEQMGASRQKQAMLDQIMATEPPKPGETGRDAFGRLQRLVPKLVSAGLLKEAGELQTTLNGAK